MRPRYCPSADARMRMQNAPLLITTAFLFIHVEANCDSQVMHDFVAGPKYITEQRL